MTMAAKMTMIIFVMKEAVCLSVCGRHTAWSSLSQNIGADPHLPEQYLSALLCFDLLPTAQLPEGSHKFPGILGLREAEKTQPNTYNIFCLDIKCPKCQIFDEQERGEYSST